MDHFKSRFTFPYLFDDYIFTPTFIKNLLKQATSATKNELTPQEIYFVKREFETNKVYVKKLEKQIETCREYVFEDCLDEILSYSNCCYFLENFSFSDILQLEWFRFMNLKILSKEVSKLKDLLYQLNLKFDEAFDLIYEVDYLHRELNKKSHKIKSFVRRYQLLCIEASLQDCVNQNRTRLV